MATWDTIDRYVVISTDTHAGADIGDYKQYLPKGLHDDFDAWARSYISPFDDLIIATASRNWSSQNSTPSTRRASAATSSISGSSTRHRSPRSATSAPS